MPTLAKRWFPKCQNGQNPAVWPTVLVRKVGNIRNLVIFGDFMGFIKVGVFGTLGRGQNQVQKWSKSGQKRTTFSTLFWPIFMNFRVFTHFPVFWSYRLRGWSNPNGSGTVLNQENGNISCFNRGQNVVPKGVTFLSKVVTSRNSSRFWTEVTQKSSQKSDPFSWNSVFSWKSVFLAISRVLTKPSFWSWKESHFSEKVSEMTRINTVFQ